METRGKEEIYMKKNQSLKVLLAGVMLATGVMMSAPSTYAAKNFTDMGSNATHSQAVKHLNSLNAFDYKIGNKLNGQTAVTRSETAVVLYNLNHKKFKKVRTYKNNFKDMNSKSPNYKQMVWAYEVGLFGEDNNGKANPKENLTRAQMSKILVSGYGLKAGKTVTFKDVNSKHSAYSSINILASNGITVGDGKGNFKPNDKVSLNELSTFVYRILNKQTIAPKPPVTTPKPPVTDNGSGQVQYKTLADLKTAAVKLYNDPAYQPKDVVVYTKTNLEEEFFDYTFETKDISQDVNGYNYYGRLVTIDTVADKGAYRNTIRIVNDRTKEEEHDWNSRMAKAEKFIVDNYALNTDYDVVEAINDFVGTQIEYGKIAADDHPYLMWWEGDSACTDYTDFMTDLLSRFGIENRIVAGDAHAWNAVHVGGNWYYTDATWADTAKDLDKYVMMTQTERLVGLNNPIETTFKATEVKFEQSMAKPYNYETQKKATPPKK